MKNIRKNERGGTGKKKEIFAENMVDFEVLPDLTDGDLKAGMKSWQAAGNMAF